MASATRNVLLTLLAVTLLATAALGAFVWSGAYGVGADDPHTAPVHALLETLRERSIETRAARLQVPDDLGDAARITQGSGNYNAMCMGCHLAPGMADTEMSRGLYPAPPNLSRVQVDAAEAFWVIKHGIKASGMPAWGGSMDDEYIWNMAAFLQALPTLSPEQYQSMVASSGGHDHGGGETMPHEHAESGSEHHGETFSEGQPSQAANANAAAAHAHPPGTPAHDHPPAAAAPHPHPPGTPADHHAQGAAASPQAPVQPDPHAGNRADDGHDHQH